MKTSAIIDNEFIRLYQSKEVIDSGILPADKALTVQQVVIAGLRQDLSFIVDVLNTRDKMKRAEYVALANEMVETLLDNLATRLPSNPLNDMSEFIDDCLSRLD